MKKRTEDYDRKKQRCKRKKCQFMERLSRFRIPVYILLFPAAAVSLVQAAAEPFPFPAGIALYVCAAVLLAFGCFFFYQDIRNMLCKTALEKISSNELLARLYRDYGYRTMIITLPSLAVNVAYVVYNGVFGIRNRSAWFITMAVYYAFLGGMRFLAVKSKAAADRMEDREQAEALEQSVLRRNGIMLLLMTFALSGMVLLTIMYHTIPGSPDIMAITTAAYTFYKMIRAVVNMIKARKMKSPILISVRNIGFAEALVSLIALQNVLVLSFDSGEDEIFLHIMNGSLGLIVCLTIAGMGIWMIRAERRKTI